MQLTKYSSSASLVDSAFFTVRDICQVFFWFSSSVPAILIFVPSYMSTKSIDQPWEYIEKYHPKISRDSLFPSQFSKEFYCFLRTHNPHWKQCFSSPFPPHFYYFFTWLLIVLRPFRFLNSSLTVLPVPT